ncbi:MAG: hypothetical protein RL160_539, partial [Bacteroidota bacterium]
LQVQVRELTCGMGVLQQSSILNLNYVLHIGTGCYIGKRNTV